VIKLYCDGCGKEVGEDANRTIFRWGMLRVEVIVAVNGVWNGGQTCLACVRHTVAEGTIDERQGSLHGTLRPGV
jgi:hypothetical protein